MNDKLAKNAVAVLRVEMSHVRRNPVIDFNFYLIHPIQVLKNETSKRLDYDMEVAAFAGKEGVQPGICTIYMERYDPNGLGFNKTIGFWVLVGGDATLGVSDVVPGKKR